MMSLLRGVKPSFSLVLLGILALAAVLRLGALRAEFWFDEIWSWEFAQAASSPWQVLAGEGQHHDNNHKLNTMYMWLCPAGSAWWMYRLHSLLAGLASVAVAAWIAHRRGRAEAVFAALLFAVNYWLVICSTEARGYALAVCFALLAFQALQEYLAHGQRKMLVLFWLSAMLGFLSHLIFLHVYFALGLWSVYHGARRRLSAASEIRQLFACHLVPGLFFLALYMMDLRRMQMGGGPAQPITDVLARLLSVGLGGSVSTAATATLLIFALGGFVAGLRLLARDGQHAWLFFAAVIVGSPALTLLARPPSVFERYFLISFVFFLLLLSFVLGALWRHSRAGAIVAVLLTVSMACGSIGQIRDFEHGGRGHFLDALAYISRQSPPGDVSLCGDFDFRVHKFYNFYVPYLETEHRFAYHEQSVLPAQGTDWLLVHALDDRRPPPPCMYDADGHAYRHVQDFPAAALAGWNWYVYRRSQESGDRSQETGR